MRAFALITFLATPALGDAELLTQYRGAIDACYHQAENAQAAMACQDKLSSLCIDSEPNGMTTQLSAMCINAETLFWDEKLNAEYQLTMGLMKEQDDIDRADVPEFAQRADRLRDAQRAWIAYRDANCAFDHSIWGGGSMRMIWGASCMASMTAERTVDLMAIRETFQ